uniref:Uncharacterized protein n=1 Tax=viral metagenome TaxID=1070528 RepID=A0A6C0CKY0_9ZZZZ
MSIAPPDEILFKIADEFVEVYLFDRSLTATPTAAAIQHKHSRLNEHLSLLLHEDQPHWVKKIGVFCAMFAAGLQTAPILFTPSTAQTINRYSAVMYFDFIRKDHQFLDVMTWSFGYLWKNPQIMTAYFNIIPDYYFPDENEPPVCDSDIKEYIFNMLKGKQWILDNNLKDQVMAMFELNFIVIYTETLHSNYSCDNAVIQEFMTTAHGSDLAIINNFVDIASNYTHFKRNSHRSGRSPGIEFPILKYV